MVNYFNQVGFMVVLLQVQLQSNASIAFSLIRISDRFLVSGLLLQCSYGRQSMPTRGEKSESLLKGTFFAMVRAKPRAVQVIALQIAVEVVGLLLAGLFLVPMAGGCLHQISQSLFIICIRFLCFACMFGYCLRCRFDTCMKLLVNNTIAYWSSWNVNVALH